MHVVPSIQVTEPARQQLTQWARGQRTPARLVLRTKSTSLAAEGHDNSTLPPRSTRVGKPWVSGVTASPPSGCLVSPRNAPRGGQPPKVRQALTVRLLKTTDHPPKPPAATPWSTRTVARYLPTPPRLCNEPRPAIGVQPYRVRAVTLSQEIRTSRTSWRMWWASVCPRPSMP